VNARSKLRFLPQLYFSPSFGQFGGISNHSYSFSAGWNLADLFTDSYKVTKKVLQADLDQVRPRWPAK
jgi:hypothetical protein